jgi:hypothetical protein
MAYFSNGSEGEYLSNQCAACPLGEKPCPVLHVQLGFNYDQVAKGQEKLRAAMNLLVDSGGKCQLRPLVLALVPEG